MSTPVPVFSSSLAPSTPSRFITAGGLVVSRTTTEIPVDGAMEPILSALDRRRGLLLACRYEVPGRYARSEVGFVDPPLAVTVHGRAFRVEALNQRGERLLPKIAGVIEAHDHLVEVTRGPDAISGAIAAATPPFAEEERTRQPSFASLLRALVGLFASPLDDRLGLYGAFGYDLGFQLDPVRLRHLRAADERDLVLYLPDALTVVDHRRERAFRLEYDFLFDWTSTEGLPRDGEERPLPAAAPPTAACDHPPGAYAGLVETARAALRRGDLFEVVPSQTFAEPCPLPPSTLFTRLAARNPAPYGFVMNLGEGEHLVGASPEMFVRVTGDRVESCPIAGTVARGRDPLEDAERIGALLASPKEESELTMCTDVDRNDKSRVCLPGSVRVLGRRQIEIYSRLIHTVDHVEGRLRPGYDALDALLSHAWAVTVTGAPKGWAMQFIEDHERSPRSFYGGAIGFVGFDGRLDTGITLRTMRLRRGIAEVRVGATLLHDSEPLAEERETELKAAALLDVLRVDDTPGRAVVRARPGQGRRVLLVDHQDSFVHTLGNYLRQTGAEVATFRAGFSDEALASLAPDLVVLSPGPGVPADFDVSGTIPRALARGLPVFGVCLGLQGMVEHFGGTLGLLDRPVHGKPTLVEVLGGRLFDGLPRRFRAGRYHSLFAQRETLPPELRITAQSDDGVPMAIEHTTLPLAAVQFHPESILTMGDDAGLRLLENVVRAL